MLTETELLELYGRHTDLLYGYVSRRVGAERALAEDIVQETWLRAVAAWRARGTPKQPGAWLVRVAHNLIASHFRSKRPPTVDSSELALADDRVSPSTAPAAALVNWGMSRLKRRQALLIEAFHFEGKSIRDMALEYGLSERAVEGRLRRARESLRELLEPHVRPGTSVATESESAATPLLVLEHSEGGRENAR